MKSLEDLAGIERGNRIGEFSSFCRFLMLARGLPDNAVELARGKASKRVVDMLEKASVLPGGGAGAGTWGEQLEGARLVLGAFSESLKFSSAFAAASATNLFVKVPLGESVGLVMAGASVASEVGRADAIPVHALDASNVNVPRRKVAGMVVLSEELLRERPREAESLITHELRSAVGVGLDAAVVADLAGGLVAHTGSTGGPIADAATLMADVNLSVNSRPFWISGVQAAVRLATSHANNVRAAADINATTGGTFMGWPLFVSAGFPDPFGLMLVDGAKIAGNLADAEVSYSAQALVQAESAPTGGISGSPATLTGLGQGQTSAMISLWQQNCVGIRVVQYFGLQTVRSGAAAVVSYAGSP